MADYQGNPNTIPHAIGNGQLQELTPAQLVAKYGSGNVKTPSRNFAMRHNGHLVMFYKNVPVVVDAALSATFTAVNAPVA